MVSFERIVCFIGTLTNFLIIAEDHTFVRTRTNLKDEYKELFGGESAISDLVFFDKPDSIKVVDGKPVVLEKTVLGKPNKPIPREETQAMKVFARAMKQLLNGINVDILTEAAEAITLRINKARIARSKQRGRARTKNNDLTNDNLNPKEDVWQEDFKDMEDTVHDIHNILEKSKTIKRNKRELWKDIYDQNDDITYSYLDNEYCFEKHSYADSLNTLRLCDTCVRQIDFGPSVVPRYANSIECGSELSCLVGDGCCYQKVVYFTFQRSKGVHASGEELWETFQQPLNVSCECEVFSLSSMATFLTYVW